MKRSDAMRPLLTTGSRDEREVAPVRRFAAGLLALSMVVVACSSNSDQGVAPPSAPARSETVVGDGFPFGSYGATVGMVAFGAYAEFHEDGTGRVRGLAGNSSATLRLHDSEFTHVVDGDQVEVTATTGDCEAGAAGSYRWSGEAPELQLADPQDSCGDRRLVLHGDWYPLGDTPVVEVDPGGDPVTIDSPIGPIDWQVVPGQAYAWAGTDPQTRSSQVPYRQVVAIDGGFVAVVDEQANVPPIADQPDVADRTLVGSENGIDWQPIPLPPSTVGLIAAHGERLYVVPATAPDAVYVTSDRGDTWTALQVEDSPASIDGLFTGPAGVMLIGSGGLLWLLDDDSFEKVPTTPARFVQVLVLDTGFFALSVASHWFSDDGRTWTEATDVPDMYRLTSWRDDVYGRRNEQAYTSTDGGRTWGAPTKRPGEDLTVTDAGYFTVQPAVFGPTVGVVWVSSDDIDWQRVVNPWPPMWMCNPVVSGDKILIPSVIERPAGERAHLDWVGVINSSN